VSAVRLAAVRAIMAHAEVSERRAYRALAALEELGWTSPEMLAVIVASAGGRVIIPDRIMEDPPEKVATWREERMSSTVLAAS